MPRSTVWLGTAVGALVLLPLAALVFLVGCIARAEPVSPATAEDTTHSEQLPFRTWSDSTGKYQTEAALVDVAGGKARLKKRDRTTLSISLERLSKVDREYVRKAIARGGSGGK